MKPKPEAVMVIKPIHSIKKAPKIPVDMPKAAPKFENHLKAPKKIDDGEWNEVKKALKKVGDESNSDSTTTSKSKIVERLPED